MMTDEDDTMMIGGPSASSTGWAPTSAMAGGGPTAFGLGGGGSASNDASDVFRQAYDDIRRIDDAGRQLDLVFLLDCTGSMGAYISSATKNIEVICEEIVHSEKLSGPDALRIGLIAYRDHPPQDHSWLLQNFGFTTDVLTVHQHLKSLYASGGGDGAEAVTAAMKAAVDLDWRPSATKMCVLIADAPPHGIGEYGDGFPNGSPDGEDPLRLARQMAARGIPLFMVACEPALSGYQNAVDFFQGLVRITGALLLPLTTASLLSHVIVGFAGEAMDMERLVREVGQAVSERIQLQGGTSESVDDVARELHEKLMLRNESTKQLHVESIYRESEESKHNVEVWSTAPDLESARPLIKRVKGSRLSERYLATRHAAPPPYSSYPYSDHPYASSPSRASTATTSTSSPTRATPGSSPSSRKVLSDFSAFSSAGPMSVSNAPMGKQGLFGAFAAGGRGGYRGRGGDAMDDDDDDDDDGEGPEEGMFADDVGHHHGRGIGEGSDGAATMAAALKPGTGAFGSPTKFSATNSASAVGDDGQRIELRQGAISFEQASSLVCSPRGEILTAMTPNLLWSSSSSLYFPPRLARPEPSSPKIKARRLALLSAYRASSSS